MQGKKLIKKIWNEFIWFFKPGEKAFQTAYAQEKVFWSEGVLTEGLYRFFYNTYAWLGWEFGNPFRVQQIRENELRTRTGMTYMSTQHLWVSSVEEFKKLFLMLEDRMADNSVLSLPVNGHLMIFIKIENRVLIQHSSRVKAEDFIVEKDYLLNKTFYRGEGA
jgi:hypothetical protein